MRALVLFSLLVVAGGSAVSLPHHAAPAPTDAPPAWQWEFHNNGVFTVGDARFGLAAVASRTQGAFGYTDSIEVVNATSGVKRSFFAVNLRVLWLKVVCPTLLMFMTELNVHLALVDGLTLWTASPVGANWAAYPPPFLPNPLYGYFYTASGVAVVTFRNGTVTPYYADPAGNAITAAPTFVTIAGKNVALLPTEGYLTAIDWTRPYSSTVLYRLTTSANLNFQVTVVGEYGFSASAGLGTQQTIMGFNISAGTQLWSTSGILNPDSSTDNITGLLAAKDILGNAYLAVLFGRHVYRLDPALGSTMDHAVPLLPRPGTVGTSQILFPGHFSAGTGVWTLVHPRGDVYGFDTGLFAFTMESEQEVGGGAGQLVPATAVALDAAQFVYAGFNELLVKVNRASGDRSELQFLELFDYFQFLQWETVANGLFFASFDQYGLFSG